MEKRPFPSSDFKWIDKISRLLDSKYSIPGTSFRFGLDPLIGLLPGVGDITTFAVSSFLILAMVRHGVSGKVIALMVINIALDTLIGGIPIIGNIFDFFFKANERNMRILKAYYEEGKYQGTGKGILIITIVVLILILVVLAFLLWKVFAYIIELLRGV